MQNKLVFITVFLLLVIAFGVVKWDILPFQEKHPTLYDRLIERYKKIKTVEVTKEIQEDVEEIIRQRRHCYASQTSFNARLSHCRKQYVNRLLQLSRASAKASPLVGDYLRCVSDCPIAAALCNGEADADMETCMFREVQCVEYCLDEYWRGGTIPVERNRDY